MFTGIIEQFGRVQSNRGGRLRIGARLSRIPIGASLAVNGACLTVVRRRGSKLEFDLSPETLRLTNLGKLKTGDRVNLETSLRWGDGLDGHLVSGHVDAAADVRKVARLKDGCVRLRVSLPKALGGLVAPKGSIAVDGTSLTVTGLGADWFETVLIPHTLKATNLSSRKPGDLVNLEADLLARYVQNALKKT